MDLLARDRLSYLRRVRKYKRGKDLWKAFTLESQNMQRFNRLHKDTRTVKGPRSSQVMQVAKKGSDKRKQPWFLPLPSYHGLE